jgi:hypothetical protein
MSIRSWQAVPSHQIELDGKVWPVVTQEDLLKAIADGAIMLDRAGGCLQVVLQRQPTPMPNEMVTVAAVVVWMDRTNAKAQPETRGLDVVEAAPAEPELAQMMPLQEAINAEDAAYLAERMAEQREQRRGEPEPILQAPDVDESDVPEALRRG